MYAVLYAGGIVIPINPEQPKDNLVVLSEGCDFVFYEEHFYESDAKRENWILMNQISVVIESNRFIQKKDLEKTEPDDLAFIIYTSGTCGANKGVMLSQKNVCRNFYSACRKLDLKKRSILLLPLYHMYGILSLGVVFSTGETTFVLSDKKKLFQNMKFFQPKQAIVVPLYVESFAKILLAAMKRNKIGNIAAISEEEKRQIKSNLAESLETIISGGAPLNFVYAELFDRLGIELLNGYGITECSPLIAVNTPEEKKKNSVGKVIEFCKIHISNPINGIGEIYVKGDNVMRGYYEDALSNQVVFEDGWFKTGDLGYLDDEGFLFISGRKKKLIICSNGENICPEELESMLCELHDIQEVIVSTDNEQYLRAEVYPDYSKVGEQSVEDLQKTILDNVRQMNLLLPKYKKVEQIVFRDTPFPRGSTGKILRK